MADKSFKLPSPLPTWPSGEAFARGTIQLGGLEVRQITSFTKIWATPEGEKNNPGVTFYRPSPLPTGFFLLGCYCQANSKPLFGWVLACKGDGDALQKPVDYTLVWSSESLKTKQAENGYIWLPTAPEGYAPVGHLVTNSPEKPPLEDIYCVRADLTEPCERDSLLWGDKAGFNVYGLRPASRGARALGVSVGTFMAGHDDASAAPPLLCLKNKSSNLSAMPGLNQIESLMKAYAPVIYFHPKEKYLPSSVAWYFDNGALLYKQGEAASPPTPIDSTGSNLPQGGPNDGSYWMDLPAQEKERERVKRGDLPSSSCYLRVKPSLGGTFTDIVVWVFYPFNGPATAKIGLATVPLGKVGEHVGDWEHLTLRVSNFSGELWRMYFSQHSGGRWVDAAELEYDEGNRGVAYASLNGHALYPKPGLVLQGNAQARVGIRNDAARGEARMDCGARFEVVSAEHLEGVVEPPWINYTREWGPRVTYSTAELAKLVPGGLKGLPRELFGEEGPTGPKMKGNWTGDEK